MSLAAGSRLGPYEILAPLGAGGMGEVYKARDTRLDREVAIKVLPVHLSDDPELKLRFEREARAISQLTHPHICTLYDIGSAGGVDFLVMELLEGKSLADRLDAGALPVDETLAFGRQIADALDRAHRAGIIHRDLKPGNVMLTASGVKLLDFGLAKTGAAEEPSPADLSRLPTEAAASRPLTQRGAVMGTLTYMSPEQLLGKPVDARSDLFSLGTVLYEMVTGRRPFRGSSTVAIADAILHDAPQNFGDAAAPERLKAAILRLLQKDPARRFSSAAELSAELGAIEASRARPRASRGTWAAVGAVVLGAAALAGWLWRRESRIPWARGTATLEATRLIAAENFPKAAGVIREARSVLPNDPTLQSLWTQATVEVSAETVPPGADISYRPYRGDPLAWQSLGKAPLSKVRVAKNFYLWKVEKPGFVSAWQIAPTWSIVHNIPVRLAFRLDRQDSAPPGMVPVPGGKVGLEIPGFDQYPELAIDSFLIDRHEVTNEEYKRFVDAGGYQKSDFWKQPFMRNGKVVPREEALASFRDATGRPGPATWEAGSFPKGQEKHPVAGVSWYEAAAYAEYSGKSLPTIYHWSVAAQQSASMLIVPGSNFRDAGTVPVGGEGALSGFGTTDMAGNVKEWCSNESTEGKRFILGGGFGEPTYMFNDEDAQSPWERRPNFGFRCVKLDSAPPAAATGKIVGAFRDFTKEKPVSDEVFQAYKGLYAYDKGDLNARVEETDTTDDWTHEKVSFNAAYGGERVIAHLYLPKNTAPPYQTIVYFPGSGAMMADRFSLSSYADFIPKSGRALFAPIYKSTFERRDDLKSDYPETTALWRDHMIMWSKDLGRSLDYLETRKDIDSGKIGYLGLSWGSALAPVLLAVEGRFKVAILESGGMEFQRALPEADQINFVSRVRIPLLMLNGKYDHFFPLEQSQQPLYRLLGTPDTDKRSVVYDSGHAPPRREFIRETLEWLDKYLGPVKR
jgi:formylglycine-generating enzyme required for sulfatase activity/dienelactone hydrolase